MGTQVDEEFFNPGQPAPGRHLHIPAFSRAHIDSSMDVGGRMADGEHLPVDKARAIYEEIVRKARDPRSWSTRARAPTRFVSFPSSRGRASG